MSARRFASNNFHLFEFAAFQARELTKHCIRFLSERSGAERPVELANLKMDV